jgi:hypothetical protein
LISFKSWKRSNNFPVAVSKATRKPETVSELVNMNSMDDIASFQCIMYVYNLRQAVPKEEFDEILIKVNQSSFFYHFLDNV